MIGLFIGARGAIEKVLSDFWIKHNINKKKLDQIFVLAFKLFISI